MSVITIVDPTGVSKKIDRMIPRSAQTTDMTAEQTVTEKKLLNTQWKVERKKSKKLELKNQLKNLEPKKLKKQQRKQPKNKL